MGSTTHFLIMKEKDWFKLKKYPHIGLPLERNSRQKWIENYVQNAGKIKRHSFLPFIHKVSKKRRYRKGYDEAGIKKLEHLMAALLTGLKK